MLLVIKWQMFHPGVYPFVFTYGSATPMRYSYDVVYFWCIWMHIKTGEKEWLWGAAAACGFGIYYLTSGRSVRHSLFRGLHFIIVGMPAGVRHFRMRPRDGLLLLLPVYRGCYFC